MSFVRIDFSPIVNGKFVQVAGLIFHDLETRSPNSWVWQFHMGLGDDVVHDLWAVGGADEALVEALEGEVEVMGVEAKGVEHGGLKVADVDRVLGGGVAEGIGLTVGAGFDAGTGHPHGEAVGVVVAAEFGGAVAGFVHGGAAKFATPNDEGVIEHAALLEVVEQCGDGAVGFEAFFGEGGFEVVAVLGAVDVPAPVEELDEADALLGEAAGEEAVVGEGGFAGFCAVGFEGFGVFFGDVHDAGDGGLHAVGQFVLFDAGEGFGVVEAFELHAVELLEGVE